jgi:hypothetical protein
MLQGGIIDIVLPAGLRFTSLTPANYSLISFYASLQLAFNGSSVDMPPLCIQFAQIFVTIITII